jgi:hypothetical protein
MQLTEQRLSHWRAGMVSLSQPQQRWSGDPDGLSASARFAGHLVEVSTDDAGGFDLLYLGFQATGYASLERAAPDFARRVLQHMQQLIAD